MNNYELMILGVDLEKKGVPGSDKRKSKQKTRQRKKGERRAEKREKKASERPKKPKRKPRSGGGRTRRRIKH